MARREHGSGSVYRLHLADCPPPDEHGNRALHKCPERWRGSVDAGYTKSGGRRRVTVTGRSKAEVNRKVRDKLAEVKAGESVMSPTTTVKAWSDTWLAMKERTISPKGYAAARGPVRKWIVPTIGHKRLTALTPADVRAVEAKQREAGLKGSTCAATQRTLFNMLRAAVAEGHAVPMRVMMAPTPKTSSSDRQPLTIPEALAVLAAASDLPHRTRWHVALLAGMRQGECLGLTWDAIDFAGERILVEWQLQRLPYRVPFDRTSGFRVPDEHESRQVHKAWHLVRPKSKAGVREYPLVPLVVASLREWQAHAPDNPTGLVWPNAKGGPASHTADLAEWHRLQEAAGVRHPTGRYYHVHECRNVTAQQLRNAGADDLTLTALMGHTSISTSEGYMRVDSAAKRAAVEKVAAMLELT